MKDLIEVKIIEAVRGILSERVNGILREAQFAVPVIEFGEYAGGCSVAPVISLSSCEQTEKERIIRLDSYSLSISFYVPESPESELFCYAYSGAVGRAVYDGPTLGGVVDRAVVIGKKYVAPKKPNCGEGWEVTINLRITIEVAGSR